MPRISLRRESEREFTLSSGAGTSNGSFTGLISAGATSLSAVYPYSAAGSSAGQFNVVSSQTPGEQSVDPAAMISVAPEVAVGGTLEFANAVGLLRFSVPEETTQVVFVLGGGSLTTVNLPGRAGTFEAAVPAGSYEGVNMLATIGSDVRAKSSSNTLVVEAGVITNMGEPGTRKAVLVRTGEQLKSALSGASSTDADIFILCDVDMTGVSITDSYTNSVVIDGCGFSILGWSSSVPLVGRNEGTIRNLAIDSGCSFSVPESASLFAAFARVNAGTMQNCVNKAGITIDRSSDVKGLGLSGIAAYNAGVVKNCRNEGLISLSATYCSGSSTIESITNAVPAMGGVVAYGAEGFSMSGCSNSGEIRFRLSAIDSQTAAVERIQIGGIVGAPCGVVNSCTNEGSVNVEASHSSKGTAFTAYSSNVCVGGIGGGDYYFTSTASGAAGANTSYTDCVNNGPITMYLDAAKSNSTCGGIVGWPGQEVSGITHKTLRCSNNAALSFSGAGLIRIGGVQGGTGNMEDCSNSGVITLDSANSGSAAGGVAGFHSQNHTIKYCSNTGNVVSEITLTKGVGGLVGNLGNANLTSGDGCSVDCSVQNVDSERAATGIVVGTYNGTTKAITLGTNANPISVKGYVSYNNTPVLVHENNAGTLASGTTNAYADNHVLYLSCTTSSPEPLYYAEGHITYNDSSAASGVTVSDGFSVSVTDSDGYYKLYTSSDTRYIYFSYPADAKITMNSQGCPDFYKTYVYGTTQYDFTLTRQAVETEFALFALGDPQAHYAKRETQKKADTDRFRDESVPAINAQISAQSLPCYGVTLGDIVYSEGNRNSTSGFATMRSHFDQINMPVFQTMGNHDFTYFNSGSPLTTDASSSTLFLKAQRNFEDCFGPVNLSFNRGDVHVVCMRNIIYNSATNAGDYDAGFKDDQWVWLQKDLANVPKSKMVILCVHIPLATSPNGAHVQDALNLIKQYTNSTVFSGHTHYYRGYDNTCNSGLYEHIHSAVCGQWWWSRIEGDGCPNGYNVYEMEGADIKDAYFLGVNEGMNARTYQMRIYRGDAKTGGSYAYFQWPYDSKTYLINVFNGDSRWTVKVYEDGVYAGNASLMSNGMTTYSSVTEGNTYTVPTTSNQDWWAIGYHIGFIGRGRSSTAYYTNMFHMWKWVASSASAAIKVEATDPYGNVYTCEDVITDGLSYPSCISETYEDSTSGQTADYPIGEEFTW